MDRSRKRDRLKNLGKRLFGSPSDALKIVQTLAANMEPDGQTEPDSTNQPQPGQDTTSGTGEQTCQNSTDVQAGQTSPVGTLSPISAPDFPGFLDFAFLGLITLECSPLGAKL